MPGTDGSQPPSNSSDAMNAPETISEVARPDDASTIDEQAGALIDEDTSCNEINATVVVEAGSTGPGQPINPTWVPACEDSPSPGATIVTQAEAAPEAISLSIHVTQRTISDADETPVEPASLSPEVTDFRLNGLLGKGGMGAVWEAHQASIDRSVALKMMLDPKSGNDKASQKFLEEAMITGRLEHPNIVPIYDLGRAPDGRLFYVMKQVQGRPWKDVLRLNSLTENLRILLRASDAVAFANSRGVIHRDLKPENIMLGEFGEVLVMDWGLALVLGQHNERNASLGGTPGYMAPEMATGPISAIGAHSDIYLLGAILFELICGRKPHSGKDVMACLLAAANNQIVSTDEDSELLDIALKAMSTNPRLRYATVQDFQQAVRGYISHEESIALQIKGAKSLKEAQTTGDYQLFSQARFGFQSALDLWPGNDDARAGLLQTLTSAAEAALEKGDVELGLSVLQPDVPEHEVIREKLIALQAERNARQQRLKTVKRTAVGLAAGLAIVMLVAIVWISRAEEQARTERDIAEKQYKRAELNFGLARTAVNEMLTEVGHHDLKYVPQMESVRRSLLEKALDYYSRFLSDQPDDPELRADTARAHHRVGDIARQLGRREQSATAYQDAIQIFAELIREFPDQAEYRQLSADSHNWLGELFRSRDETDMAEQHFKLARELQMVLVDANPASPLLAQYRSELARTLYNQGILFSQLDRADESRDAYDMAVNELESLCESGPGSDGESDQAKMRQVQQELARAYLNRGTLVRQKGTMEEAKRDYDAAVDVLRELRSAVPEDPTYQLELAAALNNIGNLLLNDDQQRDQAEAAYREGVSLLEEIAEKFPAFPQYRNELANAINSLAAFFFRSGDLEEADETWQRSQEIAQMLVDNHSDVPQYQSLLSRTLGNLGMLRIRMQKPDAALDVLKKAVESQRAVVATSESNPKYRGELRNYVWLLTEAHLAREDHASAAQTADTLPDTIPGDNGEQFRAATLVARCIPLVKDDESLSPAERSEFTESYTAKAIAFLESAIDNDWNDPERLANETAFAPLRETPAFQSIAAQLEEDANPAQD